MNAPLNLTAADLTRALVALSHDERGRLADAWRYSLRSVADHIFYINQHRKTISEAGQRLPTGTLVHSRKYVRYAQRRLAERLPLYLKAVRRVSEYEAQMDAAGIRYARSSDAWSAETFTAKQAA